MLQPPTLQAFEVRKSCRPLGVTDSFTSYHTRAWVVSDACYAILFGETKEDKALEAAIVVPYSRAVPHDTCEQ